MLELTSSTAKENGKYKSLGVFWHYKAFLSNSMHSYVSGPRKQNEHGLFDIVPEHYHCYNCPIYRNNKNPLGKGQIVSGLRCCSFWLADSDQTVLQGQVCKFMQELCRCCWDKRRVYQEVPAEGMETT